jgi:hypothetical protein
MQEVLPYTEKDQNRNGLGCFPSICVRTANSSPFSHPRLREATKDEDGIVAFSQILVLLCDKLTVTNALFWLEGTAGGHKTKETSERMGKNTKTMTQKKENEKEYDRSQNNRNLSQDPLIFTLIHA